jgi:RNA polymerase sigma-54 factor
LTATDEELVDGLLQARGPARTDPIPFERGTKARSAWEMQHAPVTGLNLPAGAAGDAGPVDEHALALATVLEARKIVNQLDPLGVGARDLRECLLIQVAARRREAEFVLKRGRARTAHSFDEQADAFEDDAHEAAPVPIAIAHLQAHGTLNGASSRNGSGPVVHAQEEPPRDGGDVFEIAAHIVSNHLVLLQKKDMRELTRGCARSAEEVQAAVDLIRTLDPRPGQRYNVSETRLIEPDVAFVKRDGEYVVLVNEEDLPTLRLSHAYRKLLRDKTAEKDVREYVKERYKSAIQLLRNIEQRKNTIVRTCEVIVRRQQEFLEHGEQGLKPMMIKEVAEEIGVHPSTVSRAVANKYVHTSQGVYELRYFFSEGVNGPEGGDLPLVLLKRKVKKLIEDEDPRKPFTDDQLAAELQRQGIRVTRRTVAKYREDMNIPSTHQRRVR